MPSPKPNAVREADRGRAPPQWAGLKFFNVYGPGQKPTAYYTSVINHFVQRLRNGEPPVIDGEGAHGPVELVELPVRFLSVIAFPDSHV